MNIHEIVLPTEASDVHWQAYVALGNLADREIIGSHLWDSDPEDALKSAHANKTHRIRRFLAYEEGEAVGHAIMRINLRDDPDAANLHVYVRSDKRGRGVGSELVSALVGALSPKISRVDAWVSTPLAEGEELPSPTGFGGLPADHPGVRMALKHGLKLGQVERVSRFDLDRPVAELEALLDQATATAGDDYDILTWEGATPEPYLADFGRLKEHMDTDVPAGELTVVKSTWDEQRVREIDAELMVSMRPFRSGVVHVPSGRLVGFSEAMVTTSKPENYVDQWDTIVLPEHRGHRLGMWLKAANLLQVREAVPEAPAVITYNAEENRHMLSVNESIGFEGISVEGAFERRL